MKKLLLIITLGFCSIMAKAQISDTTIYDGCKPSPGNIGLSNQKYADICPEFPGELKAFYKYLHKHLHYPKTNIDVKGKVWLKMVIEKNGSVTHVQVLHGLAEEFDKEALRVVKASPRWKPAILKGKPVRSYTYIPIDFTIYS